MTKTAKFAISMSEAEFKDLEAQRRRAKKTRSAFVRDAIRAWRGRDEGLGAIGSPGAAVKEDPGRYGPGTPEPERLTDISELRRRAIAAAGRFRSDVGDLSANHDKYFEDVYLEKGRARAGDDKSKPREKP
jgi:hypothetical protein